MREEAFVVIKNMSDGNESVGEMWNETKIFNGDITLSEVMDWALYNGRTINDEYRKRPSRKNIIITKPHE